MAIGCGAQIIKILLIVFNILLSLAGLGLVVIGSWFLIDDKVLTFLGIASHQGTTQIIKAAAAVILVVGIFSFVIGLVGCWGAFRQKTSCLNVFAVIICLIILMQIVGVTLAGVFHTKISQTLKKTMNETLQKDYGSVNAEPETKSWNDLQYQLSCCGVEGPSDWQTSFWKKNQSKNAPVPKTCCVLTNTNVSNPQPKNETLCYEEAKGMNSTSEAYLHHNGCEAALESWFNGHIAILIGIAVGVIIVEVVLVILACVLRARISSGYEYV